MEEHGIEYYRGSHLTVSSIDQQPSARGHALLFRILSDYPESSGMLDEIITERLGASAPL